MSGPPPREPRPLAVLVSGAPSQRSAMRGRLQAAGLEVEEAVDAIQALEHRHTATADAVVLDAPCAEELREVVRREARLARAQEIARLGYWEYDDETGQITCSDGFLRLCGVPESTREIYIGRFLERVPGEDREALRQAIEAAVAAEVDLDLDHRFERPDGSLRVLHAHARLRLDGPKRAARLEGVSQDVTLWRAHERCVRELSHPDGVTGLGNRRQFTERVAHAIDRARSGAKRVGVLSLELDQFRRFDQLLGPEAGDALLRDVGYRLVSSVRRTDLLALSVDGESGPALSRVGGDEFSLLLPELKQPHDAAKVAHRILGVLSRPVSAAGREVSMTASLGIAIFPEDADDAETLFRNAESAMRAAQGEGRNHYRFYTAAMDAAATNVLGVEAEIRAALEEDRFELWYQPKVEVASGGISGCEALLRLRDSGGRVLSPHEFIPVAEDSGLIAPLGRWVLEAACRRIRAWQDAGPAGMCVSANLSPLQLRDPRFLETVQNVLRETDIDPALLELEITESALLHHESEAVDVLRALRRHGVRISLDDFGTGYSSMSYLKRLPLDTLKIDRSFVAGIGTDSSDEAITSAIISMARALGLRVVAEGVESGRQRDFLAARGCDELQGFLFGSPRPAEEFEVLVSEWGG